MAVTIYLARHAEAANPKNILYGRLPRVDLSVGGRDQAAALIVGDTLRTLPSPMPTCMAEWEVAASVPMQGPGFAKKFGGWTWNFELKPVLHCVPSLPMPPANTEESRSPG